MGGAVAEMDQFAKQAAACGWRLTDQQLDQFARFQDLLIEWNQRINLTAVSEPALIQQRHFLDSMSCASVTGDLDALQLVDVGSGAGFPGVPLKILYPGVRLTLVDSVAKKTRFLEAVVNRLGLAEVNVITERIEVLGQRPEHRGQYDWAIARGLARLNVLVEYLLPLCRVGGVVLAQKGKNAEAEVDEATASISLMGGSVPNLFDVKVPGLQERRVLVTIQKIAETPARYPRRIGIPSKRPI